MQKLKFIVVGLALLGLTACASTPNPLSADTRDQFFVQNTKVTWALPEEEQAIEVKKDANDEGQRAEGRKLLEEKLNVIVAEEFKNSPSGQTPIDFNVAIKRYDRVGAAVGNIIGGNDQMVADVVVTDNSSGQEIAVYEDIVGIRVSSYGVLGAVIQATTKPDIEGIMASSFAKNLRKRFDQKQ